MLYRSRNASLRMSNAVWGGFESSHKVVSTQMELYFETHVKSI